MNYMQKAGNMMNANPSQTFFTSQRRHSHMRMGYLETDSRLQDYSNKAAGQEPEVTTVNPGVMQTSNVNLIQMETSLAHSSL